MRAVVAGAILALAAPLAAAACDEVELRALRVLVEQLQVSRARGEAQVAEAIAKLTLELEKARQSQNQQHQHVLPRGGG